MVPIILITGHTSPDFWFCLKNQTKIVLTAPKPNHNVQISNIWAITNPGSKLSELGRCWDFKCQIFNFIIMRSLQTSLVWDCGKVVETSQTKWDRWKELFLRYGTYVMEPTLLNLHYIPYNVSYRILIAQVSARISLKRPYNVPLNHFIRYSWSLTYVA